ncbi:hypothetical protein [Glycocaulis sp.]|uniref:hypothetical protein n=1 Tax=Glycocaulis sp. TaxID=1969725 RepID=UPI003F6F4345
MARIEKDYFALDELEERWGMAHRDLVYLAENGLLKVSVRLYGVRLEQGCYEEVEEGQWCSIPEEYGVFHGLQDVRAQDAYRALREGAVRTGWFDTPERRYCMVRQPEEGIVIRKDELVVRRDERDRAESRHGLGAIGRTREVITEKRHDFSQVALGDHVYMLGPIQARVVGILHRAAMDGSPWRHGKVVLAEAGSCCTRMSDLFKTQSGWRKLIQSDRRGRYRLNMEFS